MKWQVSNGYGKRSLVETAIGRYKSIIGPRLRARLLPAQQTEAAIGCAVLNPNACVRTPEIRPPQGSGGCRARSPGYRVQAVEVDDLGEDRGSATITGARPGSTSRARSSTVSDARRDVCSPTASLEIECLWMRSGSYVVSPRSSAAIVVTVPATPTARLGSASGSRSAHVRGTASMPSSPKRSVIRTQPTSRLTQAFRPDDLQLGRAAADVDDDRARGQVSAAGSAAQREGQPLPLRSAGGVVNP